MLTQGPTVRPSLWGGTFLDKNANGGNGRHIRFRGRGTSAARIPRGTQLTKSRGGEALRFGFPGYDLTRRTPTRPSDGTPCMEYWGCSAAYTSHNGGACGCGGDGRAESKDM